MQDKKHLIIIALVQVVFIAAWARLMFYYQKAIIPGEFTEINVDAHVRLERIYQWLAHGEWSTKILERVGTADHLVLHWTRPLDMMVAPFAWLLEPFFGLHDAVYLGGALASLPLGMAFYYMVSKVAGLCIRQDGEGRGYAMFFALMIPHFLFVLTPHNWPDHHGLLLVLFTLSLLLARRMLGNGENDYKFSAGVLLGAVSALGIWVSVEALVAVLALNAGLGLLWVFSVRRQAAKMALVSMLALAGWLAVFLFIEFGPGMGGMALDRVSLFYLLFGIVISGVWALAMLADGVFSHPLARLLAGGLGAGLAAGVLLWLKPMFAHGPMGETYQWFLRVWGGMFGDGFYLFVPGAYPVVMLAALAAIWLARNNREARLAAFLFAPALAVYTALFWGDSERWVVYAEVAAIIFIIPAFMRIRGGLKPLPRTLALLALLALAAGDTVAGMLHSQAGALSPVVRDSTGKRIKACSLPRAIERLNTHFAGEDSKSMVVMAHPNITPALMFNSRFRVYSVPIHPDGPMVHKTFLALTTAENRFPSGTGADILMICPGGIESRVYGTSPASLHARLSNGEDVPGLELLSAPELQYHIYRVLEP